MISFRGIESVRIGLSLLIQFALLIGLPMFGYESEEQWMRVRFVTITLAAISVVIVIPVFLRASRAGRIGLSVFFIYPLYAVFVVFAAA